MKFWLLVWILASSILIATASDLAHDRESLLTMHARARQAHLKGDADMLASGVAGQIVSVEYGKVELVSREELRRQLPNVLPKSNTHRGITLSSQSQCFARRPHGLDGDPSKSEAY